LNYYTRTLVSSTGLGLKGMLGKACKLPHHSDRGPVSSIGWEVYPAGLAAVLRKYAKLNLPLIVTENGVATDDENLRRDFILRHVDKVAEAVAEGIPVIGYLYWSLMDNFEWTLGNGAHFGLAQTNYETLQRIPRPCVELIKEYAELM